MNIKEQIIWEEECVRRGTQRYKYAQDRLKDANQADRTDVGSYVVKQRIEEVAKYLELSVQGDVGIGAAIHRHIRAMANDCDYLTMAFIGVQTIFQNILTNRKDNNKQTAILMSISQRLEAELKCLMFEKQNPEYYTEVLKSFKTQKVSDYTHKHKVLMKKFKEFDLKWDTWDISVKGHIASKVLHAIMMTFKDLLYVETKKESGKTIKRIHTTPLFNDWIHEFEKERGLMLPSMLPLKIKPRDVTLYEEGSYYTPRMAQALPFIKVKNKAHKNYVKLHDPVMHKEAINRLQATPWRVNTRVLAIQKIVYDNSLGIGMPNKDPVEIPPFPEHLDVEKELLTEKMKDEITDWKILAKRAYGADQERKGKILAFIQSYGLANELESWDEFYYAYSTDFRGRIYCATTGLSPQGADTAKGIIEFANGVELGEDGVHWLAVNIANKFGNDKGTYKERAKWVRDNEEEIRKTVADPISYRDFWANADKPYQLLACLFEWADCDYGRDTAYVSRQPVGLDGSCNGLQHFSAMLRDPVGAKATNLSPVDIPEDIYQNVADVCIAKLKELDHPWAVKWLKVGITRKCAKRPVMTLPYGATQDSARNYILEYVNDNWVAFDLDDKFKWELARYLTPILWEAIGEVVVAARVVMKWLQESTSKSDQGYINWITPIGFPVYQSYKKSDRVRIRTQICGEISISLSDYEKKGMPNKIRQRNGISPNFVHSMDSTHMVMTILEVDLGSYAMIHDDFGTHAGNTQVLFEAIRKTFYDLYSQVNPLQDFANQQEIEYTLEQGNYEIIDIFEADYFFG